MVEVQHQIWRSVVATISACCALVACSGDQGAAGAGGTSGGNSSNSGAGGSTPGGGAAAGGAATAGAANGGVTTGGMGGTISSGTGGTITSGTGGTAGATGGSGGSAGGLAFCEGGDTPPESEVEVCPFDDHALTVERVFYDDCVEIYFDELVPRGAETDWMFPFVSDIWEYSLATYGPMGPGRMQAIFHISVGGERSGGHPGYYYDSGHGNRNVADMGGGNWGPGNVDMTTHEIGHIVESAAAFPKTGSPAFGLWGDSKWAEFYLYDVYVALGMTDDAERVYNDFLDNEHNGALWFADWFYPLWVDHGAQVMVNFFHLLGEHFAPGSENLGSMNMGEYIHFMSGAAGQNLQTLATTAFGWPGSTDTEFSAARTEFPGVADLYTYP